MDGTTQAPTDGTGEKLGVPIGAYAIIATVVIANLGNNIVAPVTAGIRESFGTTAAQVALVASGFGFGRLLMDLPSGYLADRVSSTKLFGAGIVVTGGAAALAAMSSSIEQLILFRTAMGLGAAIMSTVALVMLVAIAHPSQRGTVLGYHTSALLFGQAISPTIGGILGTWCDWRAPFWFCAVTPFISFPLNALVTSRVAGGTPASQHGGGQRGHSRAKRSPGVQVDRPNWWALIAVYLSTFVNFFSRQGMRGTILPLYGAAVLAMDPGSIGAVLTAGATITILATLPSGHLADRIGRKVLLIPGLLVMAIGDLLVLRADTPAIFAVSTILVSMAVLANSMQSGLVADLVPERMVGNGMGMYRFTADLGVVAGPIVLGLALDAFGYNASALIACGVVLAGVAACVLLIPRRTISLNCEL